MDFYTYTKPYVERIEYKMNEILSKEPKDVYGMFPEFLKAGGKRVRPTLAILCCKAVGGEAEEVIEPASLVELFHNFTLIHDDIEDDSKFRRGKPALHISYGIPIALNSGDALYTLIWNKLLQLKLPQEKLLYINRICASGFKAVVEGQGMELAWYKNERFDISEEEYIQMINGKTAALMSLCCELGAYIGGADKITIQKLRNFGQYIGAAFQIHDDVLNITGTFEKYQKEIGGDISEGKRTLMIVHAMKHASLEEREYIIKALNSHSKKEEETIKKVIAILKKYRSFEYASGTANELIKKAKTELECINDSKDKKALLSICDFVIRRDS